METKVKVLHISQIKKSKAKEYRAFKYLFILLTAAAAVLSLAGAQAQEHDKKILNNVNAEGVIIDGYDAVFKVLKFKVSHLGNTYKD